MCRHEDSRINRATARPPSHDEDILMWRSVCTESHQRQWPNLADKSKATAILSCRRRARRNNCVWLKSSSHIYRSWRNRPDRISIFSQNIHCFYSESKSSIGQAFVITSLWGWRRYRGVFETLLLYSNAGIKCKCHVGPCVILGHVVYPSVCIGWIQG